MQNATGAKTARIPESGRQVETEVTPELQARIAVRAYHLYEESGYVPGRDMENWLEAERQVQADNLD